MAMWHPIAAVDNAAVLFGYAARFNNTGQGRT